MNIAAYCRVSTDKSDQLNSLEMQKRFFFEYIERTGDRLVCIYADEGLSGTKIKNRKEFQRLMRDAQLGLFEMVVVKDISRFARNTVDFLQSVRALKALGIETQFLTANMTAMGNSEFVLTIFGALAQEESANTSKRIKFGKRVNAENGRVPNIVYGYDKIIGDYFTLAINASEAVVVREIFELYINHGNGASRIANELNSRGIKTKRGCAWSQNAVCRILTNELYAGQVVNGKQEVADFLTGRRRKLSESEWMVTKKPELAIIDEQTFEKAQEILAARSKAFKVDKTRQNNQYLFSTLIKCRECGWSFRRVVRTYKNTYIRWACSHRNGKGVDSCPNSGVLEEQELTKILQEYFVELLKNNNRLVGSIVLEFMRIYKAKDENVRLEKQLRDKKTKLERKRSKYLDMYAQDLITHRELNEKLCGTKDELQCLENELKLIESDICKDERLESILRCTFTEEESFADVSIMSSAQLRQIVRRIEVDKDGNVDIFLCVLDSLGIGEFVPFCDNHT